MEEGIGKKVIIGVVLLIIAVVIVWFFFYRTIKCDTNSCFQDKMKTCSRATYVNEDDEASWLYSVRGEVNRECKIEVRLLQVKEGKLEMTELEGETMDCFYTTGLSVNPESDLSKCHGRLKEDLQEKIIEKLHKYILENLEEIGEGLNSAI